MSQSDFDELVNKIIDTEQSLKNSTAMLEQKYPEVFEQLKEIEKLGKEVDELKAELKSNLLEAKDFDVHDEHPDVRVSLTRVAKIEVADLEAVPDDYKETKVVANDKKALEYLRVMGEAPSGFKDKSYYRFNWIKKEK